MEYYGIKVPDKKAMGPGYIWWITNSRFESWRSFFSNPDRNGNYNDYRLPLATAIEAYEGVGYKCVKLELKEVGEVE